MSSRRNFLIFAGAVVGVLILALLLRPVITQHAVPDGNVIFDGVYELSDQHKGDLVVMGGTLNLTDSSRVTGDVSLLGENVTVAGRIDGDLTSAGKAFALEPSAQVGGDVNVTGSSIQIAGHVGGDLNLNAPFVIILPEAVITGDLSACGKQVDDQRVGAGKPECINTVVRPFPEGVETLGLLVLAVVGTLALTGLSALSVTFFPQQISHIEEAMRTRPRSYGGVGLAAYALAVGLFVGVMFLVAILPPLGLLLVPVFLILGLLLFLLSVTGLVTLTVMLGDWLLRRVSKLRQPPLIAGVAGSLALSAGLTLIALLPFGAAISLLLLGTLSSVGLGASLFTRVGTRPVGRTYFIQG